MTKENNFAIQLFEGKKVRFVWEEEKEKYYFAVVDIVQVLTDSDNPQTYWRVLKKRLRDEGNETVTNCNALKLPAADGKKRLTDVADLEQIFRLIQSIPSKKAEPVKKWLAEVGAQRRSALPLCTSRSKNRLQIARVPNSPVPLTILTIMEYVSINYNSHNNPLP